MNGTKPYTSAQLWLLLAVLIFFLFALTSSAQVTSSTSTTTGQATTQTEVRRGEVVYVSGNELVVKMEDGTLRHLNVPDSARATVDGKEVSVHDLKPGMKLEKTVTTTTTPRVVKTVTQAEGKVFHVSGNNVIVSYPDGTNKQYKVPKGTKFNIDGKETDVQDLRKGMTIKATVIKEVPETEVSSASNVTGTAPPETPPATAAAPLVIEVRAVPVQQAAATPAEQSPVEQSPAKLPNTAGELPLIGLVGLVSLLSGFAMRKLRKLIA